MKNKKRGSWPEDFRHATKVGGRIFLWMDNTNLWLDRAKDFHDAAQVTIRYCLRNPDTEINSVYAVGFLYRHSIELILKAIVIIGKRIDQKTETFLLSHNLSALWNESLQIIGDVWRDEDKSWNNQIETWIKKLEDLDVTGFNFRYPITNENGKEINSIESISIQDLTNICEQLYQQLYDCASGMLDIYSTMDNAE
ncbi:MAG: hypothetical protein KAI59_01165 [Planctomycetes bacterium]|nr:hypothetical protein [Planctomycetota bacterium]MCK5472614.1 hypothetical protein [Planctomycetota bacterium]